MRPVMTIVGRRVGLLLTLPWVLFVKAERERERVRKRERERERERKKVDADANIIGYVTLGLIFFSFDRYLWLYGKYI